MFNSVKIIQGIIFTLIIISMIVPVSALQQSGLPMIYEVQLGETQTLEWLIISDTPKEIILKMITFGVIAGTVIFFILRFY